VSESLKDAVHGQWRQLKRENRHCEAQSAVAIQAMTGSPRELKFARDDEKDLKLTPFCESLLFVSSQ
jgi:hypothetical protein